MNVNKQLIYKYALNNDTVNVIQASLKTTNHRMDKVYKDVPENWKDAIFPDGIEGVITNVYDMTEEEKVCPQIEKWFEFARLTELDNIKVVVLGMDPYPNLKNAHGLAFSSLAVKSPASLKNIYKCLRNCGYMDFTDKDLKKIKPDLTSWAEQGVLLINTALSVEVKKSGKHSKLWKPFTVELIQNLCKYGSTQNKKYVFVLWGKQAQNFGKYIDGHAIFKWLHPSPLAQNRAPLEKKFINCDHFTKINEMLEKNNQDPIIWDPRL